MDAFDDVVFTYALKDAFSNVDIVEDYWERNPPPKRPECETLAHSTKAIAWIHVPKDESVAKENGGPIHSFHYFRPGWHWQGKVESRWPFDPPFLSEGSLMTSWYADDPAALATVRKVWNLLVRVTVNRVRLIYPGASEHGVHTGRYGIRYGHHALEWCTRNPNCVIGNRKRPADDWSVPKSKWYQDLRRRVIAEYGESFADPNLGGPLANVMPRNPPFAPVHLW